MSVDSLCGSMAGSRAPLMCVDSMAYPSSAQAGEPQWTLVIPLHGIWKHENEILVLVVNAFTKQSLPTPSATGFMRAYLLFGMHRNHPLETADLNPTKFAPMANAHALHVRRGLLWEFADTRT